ncbi:MAG: DNA polymerase III subunit delta [Caldithrix sp. RBG_13_44_9]|nr:MAG: DNA polymerase III subunit delta [Caldithrix sp. RBG_13_44_9]
MIYYQQALKEIEQSDIKRSYLFFGEEQLLADDLIKRIKIKYLTKQESELNYFVRYGNERNVDDVIALAAGKGLFSDKKLIVLKEADSIRQDELDRLIKLLGKPPDFVCLILHTAISSLYQSRLKKIEDLVTCVNLLPLRPDELKSFVNEEFRKLNKQIEPDAVEILLFMVGNQLTDLSMQIQNVAQNFSEDKSIDAAAIQLLVGIYANQDVFEYTRLLGNEEYRKAELVLSNLLESGQSPQQIISQVIRHFIMLWKIKGLNRAGVTRADRLAEELKVYQKYISEYSEQSKNWKSPRLHKVFQHLFQADRELKNNSLEPQIVLDMLSFKIINSN